jgi:S1-C subfamily serine protease
MLRTVCFSSLVLLLCLAGGPVWGDKKSVNPDIVALEAAMQSAIEEAEPAIACLLISRSEKYAKEFDQGPSEDKPGILGDFDVNKVPFQIERNRIRVEGDKRKLAEKLDLSNPDYIPESFGSGVVIDDKKGLVLTHYHVIRGATKIYARFKGGKGSYANILAADPRSDLAVLDLIKKPQQIKAIKLGDGGTVRKGQIVLSIANPFAAGFHDGSPSASWGIVSNVRRRSTKVTKEKDLTKTLHHYGTLLQTDCRLNAGCSGGALIDLHGELIGLTTALAGITGSDVPGGFAVPMDTGMQRIVAVLKKGQEVDYGMLGVNLDLVPRGKGARLTIVCASSPAAKAGLQVGDMIVKVNSKDINQNDDLFLALGMAQAGDTVKLVYARTVGGVTEQKETKATLVKFLVIGKIIARNRPSFRGLRVDYTSLRVQNERGGAIPPGIWVREVKPKSHAAAAALKTGDIITKVNDEKVATPGQFYRIVKRLKGTVQLTLDNGKVVKIR